MVQPLLAASTVTVTGAPLGVGAVMDEVTPLHPEPPPVVPPTPLPPLPEIPPAPLPPPSAAPPVPLLAPPVPPFGRPPAPWLPPPLDPPALAPPPAPGLVPESPPAAFSAAVLVSVSWPQPAAARTNTEANNHRSSS